jgi:hypothetical protein
MIDPTQQFTKQHYHEDYDDIKRFISYYYQSNLIKDLDIKQLL